ncbi:pyridoxamine 5'-phosphate oxidase family protein [Streptomyces purpurogeneiscleroticus]|uniref:pyridoxamine 5'-phosphate oxidase family protein n=1 Tax=Streptomyces purpurogeneiscleroticus TaxID=68259 RepID=UPI001CBC2ABA|nr:pyridoxamine 5'-phosphate oxidase family protein [Streptomyces purpurogeneiscleroticus]MBZ4018197.1 pyridoxamine 5'-phosphate oxidase [Streptomyces purpurogeneiscleroticus]
MNHSAPPPGILQALADHTTMTLAYTDEDGPQACAVLYALHTGAEDGPQDPVPALLFVTSESTRHGRALSAAQPAAPVAFTAQRDGQDWSGLTGVQGRGMCRRLDGGERRRAWRMYADRFPYVALSPKLRGAMDHTAFWELRPTWLRLIDNARGFGHKEEWTA